MIGKWVIIDFESSSQRLKSWKNIKKNFEEKVKTYLIFRGFDIVKYKLLSDGNVRFWINIPSVEDKNEAEVLADELNDVFDGEGFWFKTVENE